MQNAFGKFRIKTEFSHNGTTKTWWLRAGEHQKPPTTLNHIAQPDLYADNPDDAREFPSTDRALPWVGFLFKHTKAIAVEIERVTPC